MGRADPSAETLILHLRKGKVRLEEGMGTSMHQPLLHSVQAPVTLNLELKLTGLRIRGPGVWSHFGHSLVLGLVTYLLRDPIFSREMRLAQMNSEGPVVLHKARIS